MFSAIIGFFENILNLKLKKQQKNSKQELKKEVDKNSKEDVITAKEKAKKSKKVVESKDKEKSLKIKIILLKVFKWVVSIIEQFITWILSVIGVYGVLIILAVIVLMIVIYGLLHIDMSILSDSVFKGNDDCIQGAEVYSSIDYDIDKLGATATTFTEYQKNLYKTMGVYSDFIEQGDTAIVNPDKFIEVKNALGKDVLVTFLFGFNASETGMQFNNGGSVLGEKDILEYPSLQEKNSKGYAFLGLHHNNVFDGTYKYNGVDSTTCLTPEFVSSWKDKYKPKETPIYDNNFIPYGVATQGGVFFHNTTSGSYALTCDEVDAEIDAIMDSYNIQQNRDKLKYFCKLFAGAGFYHSDCGSINKDLFSVWCAVWSATSTEDSKRSFDNIKIANKAGYDESGARPNILGGSGFKVTWETTGLNYFEVNGELIDKTFWTWVRDNCSNPEYFDSTAKVWFTNAANGAFDGKTVTILNAHYGLLGYLMGREIVSDLGAATPTASSGSIDDCACVEDTSGSLTLGGIKSGKINGDWPDDVKSKMESYGWTEFFGRADILEGNEPSDLKKLGESWRVSTKWKVPYQLQRKNVNDVGWPDVSYGVISHGNGCHIYMCSYIASALTGKFINFAEMFAALRATEGVDGNGFFKNSGANVTFEKLGIFWSGMASNGTMIQGSSKESCSQIYPNGNSAKEKVDNALNSGCIVGVSTKKGNYTGSGHYFVITERKDDMYKTYSASSPEHDTDWQTWEFIVGQNGGDLRQMGDGSSFWFAYKQGAGAGMQSASVGDGVTLEVPEQYGTVSTYEKEIINANSETHGWASSAPQGIMRKDAISSGRLRQGDIFGLVNCAITDDRLMVATKMNIGGIFPVAVGDYIDVVFEDGDVWNCIIGDAKGADADSEWGHNGGASVVEIIYWDYSRTSESGNVTKKISKIVKVGSYSEGQTSQSTSSTPSSLVECIPPKGTTRVLGEKIDLENDVVDYCDISKCYWDLGKIPTRPESDIKYIVVHYTAGSMDVAGHADWYKKGANGNHGCMAQYYTRDEEVGLLAPVTRAVWHAGGDSRGAGKRVVESIQNLTDLNDVSVGIEMCSIMKNGNYYMSEKTIETTAKLVRALMEKYNVPIENVVRHYDNAYKNCPLMMVDKEYRNQLFEGGKNDGGNSITWTKFKEYVMGSEINMAEVYAGELYKTTLGVTTTY